jgi:hypothetical protein
VLCDIALINWDIMSEWGEYNPDEMAHPFLGEFNFLPPKVIEWAGLDGPDPTVGYECDDPECEDDCTGIHESTLSGMNDDGYTFEQIAVAIERSL